MLRTLERENGAPHVQFRIQPAKPRTVTPTNQELKQLKKYGLPWHRAWVIMQAELGLRIREAFQACEANHDAENRTITIIAKGKKPRTVPTTPELETLWAMAPPAEPTTPILERLRGKRVTMQALHRQWKPLLRRAGVREELMPHDLRRSAAVRLYDKTHDIRAVQRLLGHESLLATTVYLEHYDTANLRPLIESLRIPTEVPQ